MPTATTLFSNLDEETNVSQEDKLPTRKDRDEIPPLPMLDASVLIPYVLFLAFWPALALLRVQLDTGMPLVDYFDIDKFMALQGMMQETMDEDTIMELPALSPAEQMVGAIFGPPPR